LIIGTFRSEEVNANVEGHGNQFAETLRLMGREGLLNKIHLSGLSQANVGEIAESMLGGKASVTFIENLAAESQGIPLFVVESLRMLYEQGGLVQKQGQWRLSIDKYNIPAKIKDVILRRVESLKPNQKRVLEAASVIGEKFYPKLVAAVVSLDSLDVLESLNTIAECTLLVHCEGNYYRFDHSKSRELLYERIPSLLRKEYHERIAENLESFDKSSLEFSIADIAYHFDQAGNKEKAIKYSLAAGKDALARFSNIEAIKYFSYVHQNIPEDIKNSDDNTIALEELGDAFLC
jgi:predicted ATPase